MVVMNKPDAWMPFYVADYLADTGHLGALEHGGYLMLILHYWRTGKPLLDDDKFLRRVARMDAEEWAASRQTLAAFFQVVDGLWKHKRVDAELESAAKRYAKRIEAARNTNAKRSRNESKTETVSDTVSVTVSVTESDTQSQSHYLNDSSQTAPQGGAGVSPKRMDDGKRGTRLAPDWEPSAEDRAFAAEHGFEPHEVERIAAEFRDYWCAESGQRARKLDWSRTWHNRIRDLAGRRNGRNGGAARREGGGVVEAYAQLAGELAARRSAG